MNLPTLSGKLTTLLGVVTAVALVLGGVAYTAMDYFSIRRAIVSELRAQAEVVGPAAGLALVMDDVEGVKVQLSNLKGSRRILRAARWYLSRRVPPEEARFDVVAITWDEGRPSIELIRGAFDVGD